MTFLLIILLLVVLIFWIFPLICFRIAFYAPRPKNGERPEQRR